MKKFNVIMNGTPLNISQMNQVYGGDNENVCTNIHDPACRDNSGVCIHGKEDSISNDDDPGKKPGEHNLTCYNDGPKF